jgi:hypothetical protein
MANSSLRPNLNAPTLPPRYPGIVTPVANHLARKEIERQLQAQGIRLTTYRYAKVVALARVYFVEHEEELFAQAMDRVRKSPWHSMMVEREERERERQERKRQRELMLMERADLPVK